MSNTEDHAQGYHLDSHHDPDDALRKIKTTGSLSISPELFEKIYLSPQNKVAGELRKTVGNPTPVALVGFLLSLTPLSCDLMQWLGAGGTNGSAGNGFYIGFGAICMLLGGIGEWILGNTFPATVFISFGGFWVAFAMTLMPYVGAFTNYKAEGGLLSKGFNASFGFILVFMGVLVFIYMIVSLRTNVVFLLIFILLIPTFGLLAHFFFQVSRLDLGALPPYKALHAAGALAFVVSMLGWYIFTAILLASVDFPFSLPVGDLSHIIKGASEKGNTGATEA